MSKLTVAAINVPVVNHLADHFSRTRMDTTAALTAVGLRHLDELAPAALQWASQQVVLPTRYGTPTGAAPQSLSRTAVRLPALHHQAVNEVVNTYSVGAAIRSGLVWIGLHHPDELPEAFAELDDFARPLPTGNTLGDYYASVAADYYQDGPAVVVLDAIRQFRSGTPLDLIHISTGLPRPLLTALSGEAVADVEGSLHLIA